MTMTSSGGYEWLLTAVGVALGVIGLAVALWACFWDRSRGRRRCPKCWYNLSGAPGLLCSECGYVLRSERAFYRTRRRWRSMIAAGLILAVGFTSLNLAVRRKGWRSLFPTTVLIALMPDLETSNQKSYAVLKQRMDDDALWHWQWEWLLDRCLEDASAFSPMTIQSRPRWPEGVPFRYTIQRRLPAIGVAWIDHAYWRAKISVPDDPGAQTVSLAGPGILGYPRTWPAEWANVGVLEPGVTELVFDVELKFQNTKGNFATRAQRLPQVRLAPPGSGISSVLVTPTNWLAGTSGTSGPKLTRKFQLRLSVTVGGSIDEILQPVRDPASIAELRESTRVTYTDKGFFLTTQTDAWADQTDLSLAFKLEFVHDGSTVSTVDVQLPRTPGSVWIAAPDELDQETLLQSPADEWTLRFIGDGEIALLDLNSHRYWSGQMSLPLHWEILTERRVPVWSEVPRRSPDGSGE